MIGQAEIARVDLIHKWLDRWQGDPVRARYSIPAGEVVSLTFSPAEVRAWPEIKAALIAKLRGLAGIHCVVWIDYPSAKRGFIMSRNSRAFLESLAATGAKVDGHAGPTDAEVTEPCVLPAEMVTRPDPYRAHTDGGTDAEMLAHDRLDRTNVDHRQKAIAARARNVAALAAEMRRPVEPRFPAEGRSERALPWSNR